MAYYNELGETSEANKQRWKKILPEVMEAIRAGFKIREFWDLKGWKTREPYYTMKPKDFNWATEQRKLGLHPHRKPPVRKKDVEKKKPAPEQTKKGFIKMEDFQESEEDKRLAKVREEEIKFHRHQIHRERYAILKKFGVKNLQEIGCTTTQDYHRKIEAGVKFYWKNIKPEPEPKPEPVQEPVQEPKPEVVKAVVPDPPTITTTISGIPIAEGMTMLVMCKTSDISEVIRQMKAGVQ